jgi:hypothetical protein
MRAIGTFTGPAQFPAHIRFVVVNSRIPRADTLCALCGAKIEQAYVHELRTRFLRRTVPCGISEDDGADSYEESAMNCSNLNCSHGIGLVSYQRGWFDKRRFCSKKCRDDFAAARPRPSQQEHLAGSYFNWLFANATSQAASSAYSRKLARVRSPARWR